MKAIVIAKSGDPSVLQVREIPKPKAGRGEALVRLKAAGLNFVDIYQRRGHYPVPLPYTPGLEGAGIVEAVGEDVSEVKVGERVAYTGVLGSFAEFSVVAAKKLISLPDEISFDQGAAFPLQGMTAHYLVHDFYSVRPGSSVLVHAAAGGVGLLLVQWLKHLGARVIGTVSTDEKAKIARDAGADSVIIYTRQDFAAEAKNLTGGKGVDYIIDGVGKKTFTKDLEAARIRGHVCLFGVASGPVEAFSPSALQEKSLTLHTGTLFSFIAERQELLTRAHDVLTAIRDGWLKLRVTGTFPLEKSGEAHRLLEERKTTGKLIVKLTD